MGRIDKATKERLNRIAGRDGKGTGLWAIKSAGDKPEALTEAVKRAGEYDAWDATPVEVKEGEDIALKELIRSSTKGVVPKVSFPVSNPSFCKQI